MEHLEMKGIEKSFAGVRVLHGVNLELSGGEVLALLGENGAGKSTLMKILTGVYQPDAGEIRINGVVQHFRSIADAKRAGIVMIHQELNLFSNLSIAENFLIGYEQKFRQRLGFVNYARLKQKVREMLELLDLRLDPDEPVANLGIGERQLVEIGKALQQDVRFLVMDEPTAALTDRETQKLFEIIHSLKAKGVGVIYISHRLEELFQIADRVTVLRDGQWIGTYPMSEMDEATLVRMMVGRSLENRYPKEPSSPGDVILRLDKVRTGALRSVSLTVRRGEIVGLGGMMGSGRTEVARAVAGIDRVVSGLMEVAGKRVVFRSPRDAIRAGVALVTEDRKDDGLLLPFPVRANLALPTLDNRQRFGWVLQGKEREFAERWVKTLGIKVHSIEQEAVSLSGGNQQKIVFGKWLACDPLLLVLDEPTRGVDVGAKQEIYRLMNDMKRAGKGILMISSDLPELLGMCDRVYVMRDRAIAGELSGDALSQEAFMTLVAGGQASS